MKKNIQLIILILMPIIMCTGCIDYLNEQTVQCEIKDKWIKRPSGDENELYLVNCGGTTYKISDLMFKGKFNSADIYGNLEIGKKYELNISGYRWAFFSEYQNINNYKEVENQD